MENPVFKLEKVVRSRSEEEMQDFEGPLDLILFLLGKNKMEIQDISISQILDQYLAWLEARQRLDLEVASEFITMASHLMYIKTRMLLSIEDEEAQSEMDALIQSLEERRRNENYLRVKSLASRLEPMGEFGRSIVTRNPEPMKRGKIYEYDQDKGDLILAMAEIRSRAERTLPPPRTAFENIVQHEPYPVESKAREILQRLKDHGITRFRLLFKGNRSRSEVVATFLAVLELCRACVIRLAGSETDCTVRQEGELPENLSLYGEAALERIEMKEIESAIEGILFASGEPVHVDRICVALELDRPTADQVLQKLMDYYSYERRGIRLLHIEDSWQLCSAPDYADYIRKAFEIRKPAKLSQPALEVLTIIAYYQPTTRAFVDQIRGVDSAYTMGLLQERKLIEECGRLQVPGRPHLYRTTKQFLRAFHLTSLEDLPEMPDLSGEGQMRLNENGQIVDPAEDMEITGTDTPESADFPEDRETE